MNTASPKKTRIDDAAFYRWSMHHTKAQQCLDNSPPPQTLELQELVPRGCEYVLNLFHQSVDPNCMSWIVEYRHKSMEAWVLVPPFLQVFAGGGQGRENCCDARHNLWYCRSARIVGRCRKMQMMCCGFVEVGSPLKFWKTSVRQKPVSAQRNHLL